MMKKIWDEICVFSITKQRLADQVRQIQVNKWIMQELKNDAMMQKQIESCTKKKENEEEQGNVDKESQLRRTHAQTFIVVNKGEQRR